MTPLNYLIFEEDQLKKMTSVIDNAVSVIGWKEGIKSKTFSVRIVLNSGEAELIKQKFLKAGWGDMAFTNNGDSSTTVTLYIVGEFDD